MVINLLLTKYQPSFTHYLACFVIIFTLVYIVKKLRIHDINVVKTYTSPQRYGLYWTLWGLAFFTAFYMLSALLTKSLDRLCWSRLYRYWLYLGVTMVLLFIDVIQAIQLNVERGVAVIATAIMLIIMYKKMRIS